MPEGLTLWVSEDIQFMTPASFDIPSPEDIRREQVAAKAMTRWADEYQDRMQPVRDGWLQEAR